MSDCRRCRWCGERLRSSERIDVFQDVAILSVNTTAVIPRITLDVRHKPGGDAKSLKIRDNPSQYRIYVSIDISGEYLDNRGGVYY